MRWLSKLFSRLLLLYPSHFRARFASEMEDVFQAGLMDAKKEGLLASFLLGELVRLPMSLAGVYIWSIQSGEGKPVAVSSIGGNNNYGVSMPGEGWGGSFLAGLPHLVMGLMIVISEISYSIGGGDQVVSGYLFGATLLVLGIGVLLYSLRNGWKKWSASWLVYIFGIVVTLLSLLANALHPTIIKNSTWVNELQVLIIPILLAYLLYKVTCVNRIRGLLAAIPPAVIIWTFFLEFVPSLQKSLAWGWIFLLAFIASVFILRVRRFWVALLLAMAVPVLGGFPFVYLGVYMGGTLPFSAPGPSFQEVLRQYLPFLMVVLTLILGPQLAMKLRIAGRENAKEGGKIFYRLALGGILLGLLFSLIQWALSTSGIKIQLEIQKGIFIASIILFLVGYALLLWTVYRTKLPSSDNSKVLELVALFFPLVFIPVVILLMTPVFMNNYSNSWLLPLIEMVWVIAAVLVVKD